MTPLALLVDAAAAYRLARLVTTDDITSGVRDRIVRDAYSRALSCPRLALGETWSDFARADPDAPRAAVLVTCQWCAGVWTAAFVTLARRTLPRWWAPAADALAVATAAGLLARLDE